MSKILILLIFVARTTLCFGQSELTGTWILDSYTINSGKQIAIKDKLKKNKLTFDTNRQYIKTYYEAELPEGARHQMTYSVLDGKVTKKYFDKNGYELKVVRVRKKTDNGTYKKIDSTGDIQFITANDSHTKKFKIDGNYLIIADTMDNRVVWSRYKKKG